MSSVCSERFQLRDIDIPPRKYAHDDDSLLLAHKFLPSGSGSDSDSDDPYSSDHFRMFEFKVRRCTRSRSHDWTDCPFAHPGEKARRRDPRRHHYSGAVCPEYRRGGCGRGDACEFAHGVFECWLHPARYRTEACKDGKQCKRKVCFFAHSSRQLRLLPENDNRHNTTVAPSPANSNKKHQHQHRHHNILSSSNNNSKCCVFCSCPHHHGNSMSSSPTSTLLGPLSPLSYKDALTDYLMTSLEALHFSPSDASDANTHHFLLSPTTPTPNTSSLFSDSDHQSLFAANHRYSAPANANALRLAAATDNSHASASNTDPDLGWVNDLLM